MDDELFFRYLIIIDDLWASSTWDIISRAFPDGDCCSRIIITTEIENVALASCRYQLKYMYEMSPFNGDQSTKLFLGRVFGSENGCPAGFKEVAYGIIRKCGGLPLATVNIASMLATESNIDKWKNIRDSLPSSMNLRTNSSSEGLKEVLNIIYYNLSPHLKTCLLYLIMYPEGYTIRKHELVKQWIVEDFVGEGQDREKIAGEYFDDLVRRGMIQPVDRSYNDEVLTCTVHYVVLDLIRYKSLEENFIINVGSFETILGLPDKVRRLSVQFGSTKCANIPVGFQMSQVRSVVYFGFFNCLPSIADYKLLRVLILHIWADQHKIFDLTRVGELFQLRYLKIESNITVHLPDEIGRLKFLEILELHAHIENVHSLGELNDLEELHFICSNTAEPNNLKNNMQCIGSILGKLSSLKCLTLVPAVSSHVDLLDDTGGESVGISGDGLSSVSCPPAFLQRLELSGRSCIFSSLPEWISELGKLCILKIGVTKLLRKDIDILKALPALTALSLSVWTAPVGMIEFDNEGFLVLKYFKFICAAPCVAFLEGAMPTLLELMLGFDANRMKQYNQIGAGLEYLTELTEVTANVGGNGADESDRKYAVWVLSGAISKHPRTPIIRVQCVDWIFPGEEDTNKRTLEIQHEIQEELIDPPPELNFFTPSTRTETRNGGQNEGTDRSSEVLTQEQEQEHWTPENRQWILEEFLDPVPEVLSITSTQAQTRDGVQGKQVERSMDVVAQEPVKHELQEELLDHLPDFASSPSTQTKMRDGVQNAEIERSMAVVTKEQGKEHCTPEKQQGIENNLLDPFPELPSVPSTQTQTGKVMQNRGTERSMEVMSAFGAHESDKNYLESTLSGAIDNHPSTSVIKVRVDQILYDEEDTSAITQEQERWTLAKPHEMQEVSLDPLPELLITTPSTQTETRDGEQKEGTDRSIEVLTQEQEQEEWTPETIQGIQEEFPGPVPVLLSTPSTQTQTRDGVQEMASALVEWEKKLQDTNATPMALPLEFLKAITSDFSTGSKLGNDGFGVVYKGVLQSGKIIAVKKLFQMHLLDDNTFGEEASYLMQMKHQNLVQLLGYCAESRWVASEQPSGSGRHIWAETTQRFLCFEYVCNESLDNYIADESSGLDWNTRYKIIKGICSGLHFLHAKRIVHLDLRPENILMDAAMMPKLADFGLSRIFGSQQYCQIVTKSRAGSLGYMASEYLIQGVVSFKADVFSLGVIIIEIITGYWDHPLLIRPHFQLLNESDGTQSTDTAYQHFKEKVHGNWKKRLEETSSYSPLEVQEYCEEVKRCVEVALKCVEADRHKRPNTREIIDTLNVKIAATCP